MASILGLIAVALSFVLFSAGLAAIMARIRTSIFATLIREVFLSGAGFGVDFPSTMRKFNDSSPLDFNFHKMIVRHK